MKNNNSDIEAYRLYTLKQLVPVLGISHRSLLRMAQAGEIPAAMIAGKWRVSAMALQDLMPTGAPAADHNAPGQTSSGTR